MERLKILFLLDIINDKHEITVPNARALEVLPHQLQRKQTGPGETWLVFPVDGTGYNPESASFVPLVRFPVALTPHKSSEMIRPKKPMLKRGYRQPESEVRR